MTNDSGQLISSSNQHYASNRPPVPGLCDLSTNTLLQTGPPVPGLLYYLFYRRC